MKIVTSAHLNSPLFNIQRIEIHIKAKQLMGKTAYTSFPSVGLNWMQFLGFLFHLKSKADETKLCTLQIGYTSFGFLFFCGENIGKLFVAQSFT